MNESVPPIKVHHHNQYLISFFAGREPGKRHDEERNWVDDSAIKLGTAMYAIHSGAEAVVYRSYSRTSCSTTTWKSAWATSTSTFAA